MLKGLLIILMLGFLNSGGPVLTPTPPILFDSIDKYVDLIEEPATSTKYATEEPTELAKVEIDGKVKIIDVTLDGVYASVFILAGANWESVADESLQTFYLEVVAHPLCWRALECTEEDSVSWYGPFVGDLNTLLK